MSYIENLQKQTPVELKHFAFSAGFVTVSWVALGISHRVGLIKRSFSCFDLAHLVSFCALLCLSKMLLVSFSDSPEKHLGPALLVSGAFASLVTLVARKRFFQR